MGVGWRVQETLPQPGGSVGRAEPGGCQAPSRVWVWTSTSPLPPCSAAMPFSSTIRALAIVFAVSQTQAVTPGQQRRTLPESGAHRLWKKLHLSLLSVTQGSLQRTATIVPDKPMPEPASFYTNVSA